MSDEAELKAPNCPHCGKPMVGLALFQWAMPPWIILECHCPHEDCARSLHFHIAPMIQAEAPAEGEPAPPGPRIHRPH